MSPLLFLGLARKAQDALAKNKTWVLAPYTDSKNIIGYKQVYKIQKKADGSIEEEISIQIGREKVL